jgi:hypothetical protein
MPQLVKTAPVLEEVRHEYFCLPQEGADAPRIEGYPYYVDDPATGRSVPAVYVTRCVECGATSQRPIRPGE